MTRGRTAGAWIRSALALILMAGSFLTLRERWQGSCIIPDYGLGEEARFFAASLFFLVGFVWLVSELAFAALAARRTPPMGLPGAVRNLPARLVSLAIGGAVYAVIGFVVWLQSPIPRYPTSETAYRLYLSVFWIVGMLFQTGNYGINACGQ